MRAVCFRYVLLSILAAVVAFANEFKFSIGPTLLDVGGSSVPVAADAIFDVYDGYLTITVVNQTADPKSVGSAVSGLTFTVCNSTLTASPLLTSSSGQEVTVYRGGSYLLGSTVETGWLLSGVTLGGQYIGATLSALGSGMPEHTILGLEDAATHLYDSANKSIAGSGPHNPFLYGSATFTVSMPGLTAGSTVDSVIVSFGTAGTPLSATPDSYYSAAPEPGTAAMALTGAGMLVLSVWMRRRRRIQASRGPRR